MKRHMENNHKGETPSITKWKHAQKQKKESLHKKYSCLECRKYFFDKSNLNRHMKNHNYKCYICAKSFYNENDLKSHLQIHHDERKHAKLNIITNLSKQKKITWRENISCVRNIPLTKITVKGFTCKRIRKMFLTIENLLLIFTNRNQLVSLRELVKHYELKSKIYFNEEYNSSTNISLPRCI